MCVSSRAVSRATWAEADDAVIPIPGAASATNTQIDRICALVPALMAGQLTSDLLGPDRKKRELYNPGSLARLPSYIFSVGFASFVLSVRRGELFGHPRTPRLEVSGSRRLRGSTRSTSGCPERPRPKMGARRRRQIIAINRGLGSLVWRRPASSARPVLRRYADPRPQTHSREGSGASSLTRCALRRPIRATP